MLISIYRVSFRKTYRLEGRLPGVTTSTGGPKSEDVGTCNKSRLMTMSLLLPCAL